MDEDLKKASEHYLDGIFGAGAGAAHSLFIERLDNAALREALHRAHVLEADTAELTIAENYLIGMCVLCATKSWAPAAMFAKTLCHLGVPRDKIFAAVARLTMWTGVVPAAEALGHVQRAVKEYERDGLASLRDWFPEPT